MFPKPISGNSIDTDSRVADVFGKSLVDKFSSDEFGLESSEDAGEAGFDDDDDDDDDDEDVDDDDDSWEIGLGKRTGEQTRDLSTLSYFKVPNSTSTSLISLSRSSCLLRSFCNMSAA